ncbi:MAG: D-aminoacyl-tRNA deacylase [Gammaproteobacteria bacterium]
MITLLQRVSEARVVIAGQCFAGIDKGLLVLVGVQASDSEEIARKFVSRLLNYRVFSDSEGKMNLSLIDVQGGLLLVPQFTLAATTTKGRRPSFTSAAPPAQGEFIFQAMVDAARSCYQKVKSGQFGADMQVQLINDGPVTFILD